MQAKENNPFLRQKITRRKLVSSLALFGLFGATAEGTYQFTRNSFETVSLGEFMRGFKLVDKEEFDNLVGSIDSKKLPIVENGSFVVEDASSNIFLKIKGIPDPSVSLSIFEATIDDNKDKIPYILDPKRYIVPLVESKELYNTTISIGKLAEGNHEFSFQPTKYTEQIPERISTELFILSSNNPVMQTMLDLIPRLSPRGDVYKYLHIPNDIPLYTYVKIRKNAQGVYLATYSFIASSEDGGSSPGRLLQSQGRTPDVEWMYMQKIDRDGAPLERVFQAKDHQGGLMSSDLSAEFHVSTANNMVAPHLEGEKIISLLPELLPGNLWGNDLIRKYTALQTLSYRELLYERRMGLDDSRIQRFIQENLGGMNLLTFNLPWPPPAK